MTKIFIKETTKQYEVIIIIIVIIVFIVIYVV